MDSLACLLHLLQPETRKSGAHSYVLLDIMFFTLELKIGPKGALFTHNDFAVNVVQL